MPPLSQESPVVIKVGGGLLDAGIALDRIGGALAAAAARRPVVVVPGGGPFADQVRGFETRHGLSADAAHWMAILAMDQFAVALADHTPGGRLVEDRTATQAAWQERAVPVLAPSRWLRAADELPHSWDVTSDSLSAYLAMLFGAELLVLVKPVAGGRELLDPHFDVALPAGLRWQILAGAALDRLPDLVGQG